MEEQCLLAEHVGDEIHLLLCGSDLLRRRGLGTADPEHRHDCGWCMGLGRENKYGFRGQRCVKMCCVVGCGFDDVLCFSEAKILAAPSSPRLRSQGLPTLAGCPW